MRYQHRSDAPKHGITDFEEIYCNYLQIKGEKFLTQILICLNCGSWFKSAGRNCEVCKIELKGNIVSVDVLEIGRDPIRTTFIDGNVHEKPEVAEDDNIKRQKLKQHGYDVHVLTNEEVLELL